jgi:signal transduction histidine kinase
MPTAAISSRRRGRVCSRRPTRPADGLSATSTTVRSSGWLHTIVTLKLAQRALHANDEKAEPLISEALEQAQQGNAELRELAHGILPAVLTQGGLRSGVNTIVSRIDLPVEVDIPAKRFGAEIEASAYFVVAEALTKRRQALAGGTRRGQGVGG